jgi:hypothetical protein
MATYTINSAPTNASDAQFRAWGQGIETALAAIGLLKSVEIGQIDWTSVLHPTLTSTAMGFAIYKFNDALQATSPVFIKFEFGSASGSANNPAIWVTIGTGSDGSGTITNIKFARYQINTGSASASLFNSRCCGNTNRFMLGLWSDSNIYQVTKMIVLERSKDVAGADTGAGLLFMGMLGTALFSRYIDFGAYTPTTFTNINLTTPPSGNGSVAPFMNCFPCRCWTPAESAPVFGMIGYIGGDFNWNSTFSIVCFDGVSRTFYTLQSNSQSISNIGYGQDTNTFLMFLFE